MPFELRVAPHLAHRQHASQVACTARCQPLDGLLPSAPFPGPDPGLALPLRRPVREVVRRAELVLAAQIGIGDPAIIRAVLTRLIALDDGGCRVDADPVAYRAMAQAHRRSL